MAIFAGVDIGSATAKAVILRDGRIVGDAIRPVGYDVEEAGRLVLAEALAAAEAFVGTEARAPGEVRASANGPGGLRPERIVATGYGRHALAADASVTEITCHARGAAALLEGAATVIDVGGQDSKAISVGPGGRVLDFVMNDKCAAGTGRFLEVMARALEVPLDEFGALSLSASQAAEISNTCTVFAESEVISQRASRRPKEEIIAGIHKAMARRIAGMARRVEPRSPVAMTGGVAKNIGLVRAVEAELGLPITVPPLAQFAGALGAALLAGEKR